MTTHDVWLDARTNPPPDGALVFVRDDRPPEECITLIRWSEQSAKRWTWWLPRRALP